MRWWSRLRGGLARAARNRRGDVRTAWKILLACALYLGWTWLAGYGLARGFSALFAAWNLNADTLLRAPAWARLLAENSGRVVSLISSAGVVALSAGMMRLFRLGRFPRLRAGHFALGALGGALAVGMGAALFLALDSMRLYERGFVLRADMAWMLAVYALAALAEERFDRAVILRTAAQARQVWGYVASALVFFAMTGGYALRPLGMVNMALTAVICARLSDTGRAGVSAGLRFGWSWASGGLLAFPGANTGAQTGARLYAVSEDWLTGGGGGLICGAWMTCLLLALLVWLFLPALRHGMARLRKVR